MIPHGWSWIQSHDEYDRYISLLSISMVPFSPMSLRLPRHRPGIFGGLPSGRYPQNHGRRCRLYPWKGWQDQREVTRLWNAARQAQLTICWTRLEPQIAPRRNQFCGSSRWTQLLSSNEPRDCVRSFFCPWPCGREPLLPGDRCWTGLSRGSSHGQDTDRLIPVQPSSYFLSQR